MDLTVKKAIKRKLQAYSDEGEENVNSKTVKIDSGIENEDCQRLSADNQSTDVQQTTSSFVYSGNNASDQTVLESAIVKTAITVSTQDDVSGDEARPCSNEGDESTVTVVQVSEPVQPIESKSAVACSDTTTDEERDRFAFISQQLDILNTQAPSQTDSNLHVRTRHSSKSPLKSPARKARPAQTHKVTRGPGLKIKIGLSDKHRLAAVKKAILSPRKRKKPTAVERSPSPVSASGGSDEGETTVSTTSESVDSCGSIETDNSVESDENKERADKTVGKKAKKILQDAASDKSFLELIQNSLIDEIGSLGNEDAYEPKQTRSKTKVGNALFPWALSPVKKCVGAKPNFMELLFSDEEDEDEEYQPDLDAETEDTDTESMVSSRMSDFGSPCPATPSTPPAGSHPRSEGCQTTDETGLFQSPKNPPPSSAKRAAARQLGSEFQDAIEDDDQLEEIIIAHRTRSKVPLTDTSLFEIESSFVAPDITADMYMPKKDSDNPDWSTFLTGLQAPPPESEDTRDTADDETSDPEYNFLAEAEEEEPDTEDFRNDMATKIPKKELSELLDELMTEYDDWEEEEEPVWATSSDENVIVVQTSSSEEKVDSSDPEEPTNQVWSSESGELTESDEAALHIAEDEETDIDKRLDAEAQRNNLTAANVKSLLHHIITNEHVLNMVQNSITSEMDSDVKEATYEPKMTRSKTKVGSSQALFPWVMSPVKKPPEPKPNFMDMLFSDEEDEDEEYEPDKDAEATETDTDSVVSSRMSDFGSPCPTTPSTPGFGSAPRKDGSRQSTRDSEGFQSPMNPPPSGRLSVARQLGRKFQDAMEKANEEDDPEKIAHRTRSKAPLTDKSLFELESSFVAPDITADMYNIDTYDPDWLNFLTGLQVPPTESEDTRDTADDETSDPEYNFLAEAEEEEPDTEDFRNDKATKVTKKELNELLDELVVAYGDGEEEKDKKAQNKPPQPAVIPRLQTTIPCPTTTCKIRLSDDELDQLNDQMIKHVQLLTQVFMLSSGKKSHHAYAKRCKVFLQELKQFGSCMTPGVKSAFHPSNIEPALDVVTGTLPKTKEAEQTPKIRNNRPVCAELSKEVKEILRSNPTFCFPQLLPLKNFYPHHVAITQKVVFTPAEDRLIAMGLEDFTEGGELRYEQIREHLLPCKTGKQVKFRIKNQAAKKDDNLIKLAWKEKKLPVFPKSTELNNCEAFYPEWFRISTSCTEVVKDKSGTKLAKDKSGTKLEKDKSGTKLAKDKSGTKVVKRNRTRSHSISSTKDVDEEIKTLTKTTKKKPGGGQSAPVSPIPPLLSGETSVKSVPLSDTLKKMLDCGPEVKRFPYPVPSLIKKIPVTLVPLSANKAIISPFPSSTQLPSNQQMAALDSSSPVLTTGAVQIPVVPTAICARTDSGGDTLTPAGTHTPVINTAQRNATCVAPSILITQRPSLTVPSNLTTTTTVSSGLLSFSGVNNMVPLSEVASQSPSSGETTPHISPALPSISQSAPNLTTKTRSAGEIMAAVAPFLSSPKDTLPVELGQRTPSKGKSLSRKQLERTPDRGNQPHLPRLVPSPHTSPSKRVILPFVPKRLRRNSPRRQKLQQQAKAILPKGFIVKSDPISPVKQAANKVKTKARKVGRPRALLPKLIPTGAVLVSVDPPSSDHVGKPEGEEEGETMDTDLTSECETQESDGEPGDEAGSIDKGSEGSGGKKASARVKRVRKRSIPSSSQQDSADSQSEGEGTNAPAYDSQTEEEEGGADEGSAHLQELMEASTTIRNIPPKKQVLKDRRSKAQKQKDTTLAMLNPDIIQADPIRDDRDIAFAQAYLDSVKTALKDDQERYGRFLLCLYEFGKKQASPVELYADMKEILKGYPDLVQDFSGFLLPEQAVKCGCYMANQQYHRVRSFLRKLEIHFEKHPSHFQKIIKTVCQPGNSPRDIQTLLQPLLKGQQHLLEEFSLFFENERPPESHMTDFEEIDMGDSDMEEGRYLDGYEEVELSDDVDHHGTKRCECKCHDAKPDSNFFKRKKHCKSCGLKVIGGKLYFRTAGKILRPAEVVYHKSFWMDEERQAAEVNSCTVYNKDTSSALTSVENIVSANGLQSKPPDKVQVEPGAVRKRIKPITLRAVPQGGRFIALDEVDETQDRSSIPWMTIVQSDKSGKTSQETGNTSITIGETGSKTLQTALKSEPGQTVTEGSGKSSTVITQTSDRIKDPTRTADSLQTLPVISVRTTDNDTPTSNAAGTYSSTPRFFPSPSKDSNSSSSHDILAKAMKVAHVMNSDSELSMDQSLMPKQTEETSTTGACLPGEITFGHVAVAGVKEGFTFNAASQEQITWTKEADRLILETCKSSGPSDPTFQAIAQQLGDKSETQVRERFASLMSLFMNTQLGADDLGEG